MLTYNILTLLVLTASINARPWQGVTSELSWGGTIDFEESSASAKREAVLGVTPTTFCPPPNTKRASGGQGFHRIPLNDDPKEKRASVTFWALDTPHRQDEKREPGINPTAEKRSEDDKSSDEKRFLRVESVSMPKTEAISADKRCENDESVSDPEKRETYRSDGTWALSLPKKVEKRFGMINLPSNKRSAFKSIIDENIKETFSAEKRGANDNPSDIPTTTTAIEDNPRAQEGSKRAIHWYGHSLWSSNNFKTAKDGEEKRDGEDKRFYAAAPLDGITWAAGKQKRALH